MVLGYAGLHRSFAHIFFTNYLWIALTGSDEGFVDGSDDDIIDLGITLAGSERRSPLSSPICLIRKFITNKVHNAYTLIDVTTKAFHPKGKLMARVWGKVWILFSFK